MGYNRADYIRIKQEYTKKYLNAREISEQRRREIHAKLPDVFEIDRILSKTGMEIMAIIRAGGDTQSKIAELEARNSSLIDRRGELLVSAGYAPDYTDVHYECSKCSDTGYVDGVMCECMRRALVAAGYQSSGLGALIGSQTFDNFEYGYYREEDGTRKNVMRSVEQLKKFAEGFDKDTYSNFLMIGSTGLGKTHLSTAVAQTVIDKGFDVLYVGAVGMMSDFEQKRFGNAASTQASGDTERYYTADLLIIDDLGTEVVNKFTQSYFYDVINTRINMRLCTIINTNLSVKELNSLYTERISSRILGEYLPMQFFGVDIRRQKSTK